MERRLAQLAGTVAQDLPPMTHEDPERVRALIAEHVAPAWQAAARAFWGVATPEDHAELDGDDADLWDETSIPDGGNA